MAGRRSNPRHEQCPFLVSNLVDDLLVLRTSTELGPVVAEMHDQLGRLCSSATTKEIDVHALANGRYTLLLTHGTDRHALPFVCATLMLHSPG